MFITYEYLMKQVNILSFEYWHNEPRRTIDAAEAVYDQLHDMVGVHPIYRQYMMLAAARVGYFVDMDDFYGRSPRAGRRNLELFNRIADALGMAPQELQSELAVKHF